MSERMPVDGALGFEFLVAYGTLEPENVGVNGPDMSGKGSLGTERNATFFTNHRHTLTGKVSFEIEFPVEHFSTLLTEPLVFLVYNFSVPIHLTT